MYYYTIIGITETALSTEPPVHTEIRISSDSFDNALGKAEAVVPGCNKYLVVGVNEKTA